MAKAINMPKMGNTVESVIVGEIFIKVGDKISKDQKLFNYETDKSTTDYKAEIEGEVLAILMSPGDEVEVLKPVIIIGNSGDDISQWTSSKDEDEQKPQEETKSEQNTNTQEIKQQTPPQSPSQSEQTPIEPTQQEMTSSNSDKVSWRAKQVAQNLNVNPKQVSGTSILGRVVEKDILKFYHTGGASALKNKRPAIESRLVPFSPVRKAISQAMKNSLAQTSQLSMAATFDASEILKLRKIIKNNYQNLEIANASVNDIIVFALSRILPRFPHLNAILENDQTRQYYVAHIGIAVDTPNGLFVPVVKDASLLSLSDIATKSKELISKTRSGKLQPNEMKGGTFTVTNLGLTGVSFFTPILNYPQVAIIGVGSPIKRIRLNNQNQIEQYQEITLSLTMDHGANDGAAGTKFLQELVKILENITVLLI